MSKRGAYAYWSISIIKTIKIKNILYICTKAHTLFVDAPFPVKILCSRSRRWTRWSCVFVLIVCFAAVGGSRESFNVFVRESCCKIWRKLFVLVDRFWISLYGLRDIPVQNFFRSKHHSAANVLWVCLFLFWLEFAWLNKKLEVAIRRVGNADVTLEETFFQLPKKSQHLFGRMWRMMLFCWW